VDAVEFRELLQYTHHPARKTLKVPHAKSVKVRIDKMGEEMVASLSEMFKVCYIPATFFVHDSISDFRRRIRQTLFFHSTHGLQATALPSLLL
jgi:hypothetical protein